MTVLITGASGVVGGAVLRHLVAGGREVRALVRSSEAAEKVRELGASPVPGDVREYLSVLAAVDGAEVVYHVAGVNQMCGGDPAPMIEANVEGTRNVVRAAGVAGVRRVVYTSSSVAIGEDRGTVGTEESPHRGLYLSHYERSKHLAEKVAFAEQATEVVAVNPSSVQGPGRATGTGKLILDVLRGKVRVLPDSRLSIVDIDDCAAGHLLAEEQGVPGTRYLLSGFSVSMRHAVRLLEDAAGTRLKVRFLPPSLVLGMGLAAAGAVRLVGRRPRFCAEMLRTMRQGHAYDGTKAYQELGLEYRSPQETMSRTVEWFRREGLL